MNKKKQGKKKQDKKFPSLTTTEAEEIVQELGKALDVHREWTEKFRGMLVCRTRPTAKDLDENAYKKTTFGMWCFGNVSPHLKVHPGFAIVGKNTEELHKLACKLAQLVAEGKDIELPLYNSFVESVGRFQTNLRTLLSEAWECLRYTDPLTGVMTRTAMQARLEGEQERSRRNKQICCVGIMDLDHFKKVNDTHGHPAGDKVLKTIAKYVSEHLRNYDQVFRYGGEEFLLLLPNSSQESAKKVLDRLRRGIKRHLIKLNNGAELSITASFGISELRSDIPAKVSIEIADKALYKAKNAGRNRVCISNNI